MILLEYPLGIDTRRFTNVNRGRLSVRGAGRTEPTPGRGKALCLRSHRSPCDPASRYQQTIMLCKPGAGTELVPWGTSKEGQPLLDCMHKDKVIACGCRSVWTGASDSADALRSHQ